MKNKKLYKVGIEYNEPLKGYISKDEERARILYDNPDNKNKKEIGLEIIEEYKDIPIAEPVIYVEEPERTKYQSDLKQARRNAVNQARKQQRTVKSVPNINPQTKMEYINKPKIGLGQNTYIVQPKVQEEFTIGKRENKTSTYKKQKNYEEIAEMFYPSMEVKSEIAPLKNKTILPQSGMYIEPQTSTISDAEKLLYPNGTLGEMTPKKLYDLTNYGEQYEKVGNVLYPKTDDPKINALKKAAKKENFEIQKERTLTHAKNFGGAALILGTSLVPGVGEARVTVGLAKTLGPIVGKKIAETAAKGIIKGPIQGAVAGLGEGLINDENLLKSVARGAGIGLAAGATIGLGVGKYSQIKAVKQMDELLDKRTEWGIAYRKYSYKPEEAIEMLLKNKKGFVPNAIYKKGVGNIDFVWGVGGKKGYGLAHIIDQRNSQNINGIEFVRKIPTLIKEGKVKHPQNQNVIFIETKDDRAVIKLVWDIKERKWIVTSFKLNKPNYGN